MWTYIGKLIYRMFREAVDGGGAFEPPGDISVDFQEPPKKGTES